MKSNWSIFDKGKSIGTKGTEEGTIIKDEEHLLGARITLEEKGTAPFSITMGIYGLLFHTDYCSTLNEATLKFKNSKAILEDIIDLCEIEEKDRSDEWNMTYNSLVEELTCIK